MCTGQLPLLFAGHFAGVVHLLSLCFTVCNIYLPSAIPVSLADLINLISHSPLTFILLADFNAENILFQFMIYVLSLV